MRDRHAPGLVDACVLESLKVPARIWREAFAGFLELDHRAELGRITAPTLIANGDRDAIFTPAHQRELHDAIPGSELLIYAGGGHAAHWEDPDTVTADLASFLDKMQGEAVMTRSMYRLVLSARRHRAGVGVRPHALVAGAGARAPPQTQAAPQHKHYEAPPDNGQAADPSKPVAPRLQNLGVHKFPVTTAVPRAQLFISQGVNLAWAFNHAEAARSFSEAARLDPKQPDGVLGARARPGTEHQRVHGGGR